MTTKQVGAIGLFVTATLWSPAAAHAESSNVERDWEHFGCVDCHGDTGYYRDKIRGAIGKPVDQVARWIRNAPSVKPGTPMPSYAGLISEPASVALAEWVQRRAAADAGR